MVCPNCFFENRDETKETCPFCKTAYHKLSGEPPSGTLQQPLRRSMRTHSAAETNTPAPTVEAPPLPTPENITDVQRITPDSENLLDASYKQGEKNTTPAAKSFDDFVVLPVERTPRAIQVTQTQKKKRLPAWVQALIWVFGIATVAAVGYFFSKYYAENNINGWTNFWENIFSNWR